MADTTDDLDDVVLFKLEALEVTTKEIVEQFKSSAPKEGDIYQHTKEGFKVVVTYADHEEMHFTAMHDNEVFCIPRAEFLQDFFYYSK